MQNHFATPTTLLLLKSILLLLLITIVPFSSPHSEAINTISTTSHVVSPKNPTPPVEKKKQTVKKKTKKRKTNRKSRRLKITKKTQDRVPGFSIMLIGGILLLVLAIIILSFVFSASNGFLAAMLLISGVFLALVALGVSTIGSIFLAKGIRENKMFREIHNKTEGELKKELAESIPQKFPHLNEREVRTYISYQVSINKLQTVIALKNLRDTIDFRKINHMANKIKYYEKRIKQLEDKKRFKRPNRSFGE